MTDNFKNWLKEEEMPDPSQNRFIKLYHGGTMWDGRPEVFPSEKGKYEVGNGIYLTTSWDTARKYAKGSKVVLTVYVDPNFKTITDTKIPLKDIINFLQKTPKIKKRKEIIQGLVDHASRMKKDVVALDILNNLIVNFEAGAGSIGLEINKFIRQHADAEIYSAGYSEDWLVVFNTDIIKKWHKTDTKLMKSEDFNLPKIKDQMQAIS